MAEHSKSNGLIQPGIRFGAVLKSVPAVSTAMQKHSPNGSVVLRDIRTSRALISV